LEERPAKAGRQRKEKVMFTMVTESTRRTISAVAAVAVVAFTGLTLEQGHLGALPQGTVEVGELTPIDVMQLASVTLPEIVVIAERTEPAQARVAKARSSTLPALSTFDANDGPSAQRTASASVLLK
jgi:hypothetical protein